MKNRARTLSAHSDGADSMEIATVIPVGARPTCVTSFNGQVWVTNTDEGSVSVIACSTDRVVATVPVGSHPTGVVIDPQVGGFVANSLDGTISVLSLDNTPKATIEIDGGPLGLPAAHPVGLANLHLMGIVVVVNREGGVARIQHGGPLADSSFLVDGGEGFPLGVGPRSPHGVAVASFPNPFIYVSSPGVNRVSIFDTSSGSPRRRGELPVGQRPAGVATHPLRPLAYVANSGSDTLSVIQGESVTATIGVSARPLAVAVGRDDRIWVSHDTGKVSIINALTNMLVADLAIGTRAAGICVDQVSGKAYVANSDQNTVTSVDPHQGS